jgi:hypothetical protein
MILKIDLWWESLWKVKDWLSQINLFRVGRRLRRMTFPLSCKCTEDGTVSEKKYFHPFQVFEEKWHSPSLVELCRIGRFVGMWCSLFQLYYLLDSFNVKKKNRNSYIIMLCIFLKRIFLRNSLKKPIHIRWKINSQWKNNRNTHYYTLGPLFRKWLRLQYLKSMHTFTQCQES